MTDLVRRAAGRCIQDYPAPVNYRSQLDLVVDLSKCFPRDTEDIVKKWRWDHSSRTSTKGLHIEAAAKGGGFEVTFECVE